MTKRPMYTTHRQRGSIHTLLSRPSPFGNETGSLPVGEFPPNIASSSSSAAELAQKILVVGAGGLGCEILKDLGMLQIIREVTVIDLGAFRFLTNRRQTLLSALFV